MGKPKIRFKGYVEDWEQRKVTELGEVYIGLVTTMTAHYTNEGTLLIRNSDIKDGKFEFDTEPIYLDKEFAEQNKSRMHKVGDVITVHTGDVGTSAVITENEANSIGFATIVTRPNQKLLDSYYLSTFLNTEKHKAWAVQMSTGDGRTNYNLRDYTELVVPVPKLEEQKKIASYISSLNNLITLHQRKCEETKILKKYMLQKMFPQNGKKVPEIRFSGYTEDWEQRKLGMVCDSFEYGLNVAATDYDGKNKYIRITDIDDNSHEFLQDDVTSPDIELSGTKNYKLKQGDILFARTGASVGKTYIYKESDGLVYYAGFLIRGHVKDEYSPEFVFQNTLTADYDKFIRITSQRSGQPGVNAQEYASYQIAIPTLAEQKEIGAYFSTLDHLITLHQHKCEELRKIKKYMLQNMFV